MDRSAKHILPKGSSCQTCKARKVKCDALKPSCTACQRSARFRHEDPDAVRCCYTPTSRRRSEKSLRGIGSKASSTRVQKASDLAISDTELSEVDVGNHLPSPSAMLDRSRDEVQYPGTYPLAMLDPLLLPVFTSIPDLSYSDLSYSPSPPSIPSPLTRDHHDPYISPFPYGLKTLNPLSRIDNHPYELSQPVLPTPTKTNDQELDPLSQLETAFSFDTFSPSLSSELATLSSLSSRSGSIELSTFSSLIDDFPFYDSSVPTSPRSLASASSTAPLTVSDFDCLNLPPFPNLLPW